MSLFHQPTKMSVLRLLHAANLPTADLTDAHLQHFWGYGEVANPVAIIGLEPFADAALLRSLAVTTEQQNLGIGTLLVKHAEKIARAQGITQLYLLTATAQEFFEHLGYACLPRNAAPSAIRNSREFADICPLSSVLMKKDLRKNAKIFSIR